MIVYLLLITKRRDRLHIFVSRKMLPLQCVDGSDSCENLGRVKQLEFYDLKTDPFETNNLIASGIPAQHLGTLKSLAKELEERLDVEVILE